MIFVDTGPLYALAVPADACHNSAASWYRANPGPLLTTDLVAFETITLLRRRKHHRLAVEIGERLFRSDLAFIEWLTRDDISAAWNIFRDYRDKDWSFTDCTSRVVMQRLGITQAFSFDEHFRQFGTVTIVP